MTSVDRIPLGNGQIGPITEQVDRLYHDVVRGAQPRYAEWLTPV